MTSRDVFENSRTVGQLVHGIQGMGAVSSEDVSRSRSRLRDGLGLEGRESCSGGIVCGLYGSKVGSRIIHRLPWRRWHLSRPLSAVVTHSKTIPLMIILLADRWWRRCVPESRRIPSSQRLRHHWQITRALLARAARDARQASRLAQNGVNKVGGEVFGHRCNIIHETIKSVANR